MLNNNARKYYTETLENSFGKLGYKGDDLYALVSSVLTLIARLPQYQRLPDNFFDFNRSIRILARQEQKTVEQICLDLPKNPAGLFYVHELLEEAAEKPARKAAPSSAASPPRPRLRVPREQPARKRRAGLTRPDDSVIVQSLLAFHTANKRLPNTGDGGQCLPENSVSWAAIFSHLRKNGTTPRKLIEAHQDAPYKITRTAKSVVHGAADGESGNASGTGKPVKIARKRGKTPKPPLPDEDIVKAAIAFREKYGRLPALTDKNHELPAGAVGWAQTFRGLRARGTTIGRLIKAHEALTAGAPLQTRPPIEAVPVTPITTAQADFAPCAAPSEQTPSAMPEPAAARKAKVNGAAIANPATVNPAATNPATVKPAIDKPIIINPVIANPAPAKTAPCGISASEAGTLEAAASEIATVDAARVFADTARFIRQNNQLPSPSVYHHFIAGHQVGALNKLFREGAVAGWQAYVPDGAKAPANLGEFMLAAQLARTEKNKLAPAPKKQVRALERHFDDLALQQNGPA